MPSKISQTLLVLLGVVASQPADISVDCARPYNTDPLNQVVAPSLDDATAENGELTVTITQPLDYLGDEAGLSQFFLQDDATTADCVDLFTWEVDNVGCESTLTGTIALEQALSGCDFLREEDDEFITTTFMFGTWSERDIDVAGEIMRSRKRTMFPVVLRLQKQITVSSEQIQVYDVVVPCPNDPATNCSYSVGGIIESMVVFRDSVDLVPTFDLTLFTRIEYPLMLVNPRYVLKEEALTYENPEWETDDAGNLAAEYDELCTWNNTGSSTWGVGDDCRYLFETRSSDPGELQCSFTGAYEVLFDVVCVPGTPNDKCPVFDRADPMTSVIPLTLDTGDHCPFALDDVTLVGDLYSYLNDPVTTPGQEPMLAYLNEEPIYFEAEVRSPQASVDSSELTQIDFNCVVDGAIDSTTLMYNSSATVPIAAYGSNMGLSVRADTTSTTDATSDTSFTKPGFDFVLRMAFMQPLCPGLRFFMTATVAVQYTGLPAARRLLELQLPGTYDPSNGNSLRRSLLQEAAGQGNSMDLTADEVQVDFREVSADPVAPPADTTLPPPVLLIIGANVCVCLLFVGLALFWYRRQKQKFSASITQKLASPGPRSSGAVV